MITISAGFIMECSLFYLVYMRTEGGQSPRRGTAFFARPELCLETVGNYGSRNISHCIVLPVIKVCLGVFVASNQTISSGIIFSLLLAIDG